MKTITFQIHETMKEQFDAYCKSRGLTMAEIFRCYILGKIENPGEEDLNATIQKLIAKRDRKQKKDKGECHS